ncbi:SDR family oxidoreductase [Rapidithrix thailandica]|uniref:SDR family oxidoreductase n=1 Tax=Rapidithrix thailandica TaxID=413964 RepID=A0AAW9S338_9BACT
MEKVLVAGATGYLGRYIVKELARQAYYVKAIGRSKSKLQDLSPYLNEAIEAEVTRADTLEKALRDTDVVISTVGITRQKDGLTYMDVDYQANMNLLRMAQAKGVKKFIYVSVFRGDQLTQLKICEAKEKFAEELQQSGMEYCIVRPDGFFSDMTEILNMANNGRVYLIGNGECKANPIHGEDLAEVCVQSIHSQEKQIPVGGPEVLSHKQIAQMAFAVCGKKAKITYLPLWLTQLVTFLARTFTSSKTYGPVEFFLTAMSMDMVAPVYGKHTLQKHFEKVQKTGFDQLAGSPVS